MSQDQIRKKKWHRDGPDEGYIDCFVPLIDLTSDMGPTILKPKTHIGSVEDEGRAVVPLLGKGDVLLFDYRTLHRGQGNMSKSTRTLAYAVFKRKGGTSTGDSSGDIHNFPAALTLEYD